MSHHIKTYPNVSVTAKSMTRYLSMCVCSCNLSMRIGVWSDPECALLLESGKVTVCCAINCSLSWLPSSCDCSSASYFLWSSQSHGSPPPPNEEKSQFKSKYFKTHPKHTLQVLDKTYISWRNNGMSTHLFVCCSDNLLYFIKLSFDQTNSQDQTV